jgi:hypothetical protein
MQQDQKQERGIVRRIEEYIYIYNERACPYDRIMKEQDMIVQHLCIYTMVEHAMLGI